MDALLTVEEIQNEYPDEWVCVEVIEEDENGELRAGHLVAHDREKSMVVKAAAAFRSQNPKSRGSFFFTGELIPKGMVVIFVTG